MQIMDIGFRIKQAIGLTGYSVSVFCEKTGISRSYIGLLISGRAGFPKIDYIESIAIDLKLFNVICSANWIMNGTETSPRLSGSSESELKNEIPDKENQNQNQKNTIVENFLKKTDDSKTFDIKTTEYYMIFERKDIEDIIDQNNFKNIYIESKSNKIKGVFDILGFCSESEILILKLKSKYICVNIKDINFSGKPLIILYKK